MAVNNTTSGGQENKPNAQQTPPYQQQPSEPMTNLGLGGINSQLRRSGTVDRTESRSAEALSGLRNAAKGILEAQGLSNDFELFRFDRDDNRVGLPSILVVKSATTKLGKVYAVRTLLLGTDGLRLRMRTIPFGMQRIEVPTLPQDVYTDLYWNRIKEFICRTKGITPDPRSGGVHVFDAGALHIPASYDFSESKMTAVQNLLITSVNRCDDTIAYVNGEAPIDVSVRRSDERITASIDFTGSSAGAPPDTNIVGIPHRSDIKITMNRRLNSNNQSDEFYERESSFNSVSGFINLEFTPPQMQQQPVAGWGQPQQPTQLFTPTFVITDVSQADWIQAQTPELYLLALSNAYRVTANSQWIRQFSPLVGTKGIDMYDVGALGYLTQAGARVDIKGSGSTEDAFIEFMTAMVRPNPTFLIDIDPMGDHAAIENYFTDAAFDGPSKTRANERLIRAADNLTKGIFGQIFDRSKPIVIPYMQQIHLGYYEDASGDKRDIRDLDVLAMLNLTQGNIQDFFEWYQTYVNTAEPNELKLQRREKIERHYLRKDMVITGRADRLMLHPSFIEALDESTRRAGLQVEFENLTSIMGAQRFVGNQMASQYSVTRNASAVYGTSGVVNNNYNAGVTGAGRHY